jgi:FkbM family methyltransferase
MRSFLSERLSGLPVRGGTFLEIGGVDGLIESNTWVLERCFGWRGVLIEGHPLFFERLRANRPASLNVHAAACDEEAVAGDGGGERWVKFDRWLWTGAKVRTDGLKVQCVPVGYILRRLGVARLDYVSIDVEGAETAVVNSIVRASRAGRLSLGVVVVESRADGKRQEILSQLLGCGMHYVGSLHARGSERNLVTDDVFYNATHLQLYWPQTRAAAILSRHAPD